MANAPDISKTHNTTIIQSMGCLDQPDLLNDLLSDKPSDTPVKSSVENASSSEQLLEKDIYQVAAVDPPAPGTSKIPAAQTLTSDIPVIDPSTSASDTSGTADETTIAPESLSTEVPPTLTEGEVSQAGDITSSAEGLTSTGVPGEIGSVSPSKGNATERTEVTATLSSSAEKESEEIPESTPSDPPENKQTAREPYYIDIPIEKKIGMKQRRKLWEEIERRKPLIPKHVTEHIRKYAKPPFETWSCKYKGRLGTCFGCSK